MSQSVSKCHNKSTKIISQIGKTNPVKKKKKRRKIRTVKKEKGDHQVKPGLYEFIKKNPTDDVIVMGYLHTRAQGRGSQNFFRKILQIFITLNLSSLIRV